jgi:acyl-coenzyme A synthetase/AMP-(fatty) acid ligase
VAMVGVVGLPHPERGEEVAAFVKLKPGLVPSVELEAQLQELVRRKVATTPILGVSSLWKNFP